MAVELVESKHGYAAVPLVRPACEELLWLRYFTKLTANDAALLSECLIRSGLLRDLDAQANEMGREKMLAIGLAPALNAFHSKASVVKDKLRQLGKRLDWPGKQGRVPSTRFIADATDSTSLYLFLYHAASRYVHFSPVELGRRGWGKAGRLELSSQAYEPVWAAFVLSWSTRLLGWSMTAASSALEAEGVSEPDHETMQNAFDRITDVPLVPLVTPEELLWDS